MVKSARRLRMKEFAHLIRNFRIGFEGLKSVSKSLGDVERPVIHRTQLEALPLAKSRRLPADINDHVKDRSASAANELRFFVRRRLKVHATQRATRRVEGDAALDKPRIEAAVFKFALTPRPRKEPPLVFVTIGLNEPRGIEFRRDEFHRATLQKSATGKARLPPSHTLVLLRWWLGRSLALPIVATRL